MKRLISGDKMSKMSSSIVLLLSILAVASTSDECKRFKSFILLDNYKIDKTLSKSFPFRFCPEDIKAAVFRPMVKELCGNDAFLEGVSQKQKSQIYIDLYWGVVYQYAIDCDHCSEHGMI